MTALEARCGELMGDLDRLGSVTQAQGIQDQVKALDDKAVALSENSAALKAPLETMMKGGLCAGVSWSGISKLLDELDARITRVLEKLQASPEKINDGQVWPRFENLAHKVATDLREVLKGEWSGFVTRNTLNRVSVFSIFKGLAQCRDAIDELEELDRKAKARMNLLPQTPEDISFIIEISNEMTALINGLGIEGEPPEMIEFLKRCASGSGVSLSELTDKRLAWLRSKGFEESLRVRG